MRPVDGGTRPLERARELERRGVVALDRDLARPGKTPWRRSRCAARTPITPGVSLFSIALAPSWRPVAKTSARAR
jgi:hypothetical protein